jgi:two-component system, chemotaxis family, chemotaxis protein CheY
MSYNILIVDDSETVRQVVAKTLDLAGVPLNQLHQAANGSEALAIMREQWVDLVFTDINMPVMTGVEMIEEMERDKMLSRIPVIVISTEGSRTRIEDLMEKGVKAYIRKPFTPEKLKAIVDEILGGVRDE